MKLEEAIVEWKKLAREYYDLNPIANRWLNQKNYLWFTRYKYPMDKIQKAQMEQDRILQEQKQLLGVTSEDSMTDIDAIVAVVRKVMSYNE